MRKQLWIALMVLAVGAGLAVAAGAGYSRLFTLPESGELTIRNTQKNDVWRPCAVAVICPDTAGRTVSVYRVVGDLEYPITDYAATGQTYVCEFEANYWCSLSNGVKVVVTPPCTGVVEVIYE
ncbi:MAG: hypothetical protein HN919_18560 [Verrucomicrobia bacterium]|nr:hypothetical protein [Verrucomicrobiota bacterium]